MSLRRILAAFFAFCILACFAVCIGWFLLGGQQKARREVIAYLQPILGPTFDIAYLDFYPTRAVARGVTLDPSPSVHIRVRTIQLDYSFWKTLLNLPDLTGSIDNLDINDPTITITAGEEKDSSHSSFQYKPYLVKQFEKLALVRRIRINDLAVVEGATKRVWVERLSGFIDLTDPTHVTANLDGSLPPVGDGSVAVVLGADLSVGTFLVAIKGVAPNLESLEFTKNLPNLQIKSGRATADIEMWGESDLRFGGAVNVSDVALDWNDKILINEVSCEGRLFGQRLDVDGKLTVNGLPLGFSGAVSSLFTGDWDVRLNDDELDLGDFDGASINAPSIKGTASVALKASGGKDGVQADLKLKSARAIVGGVELIDSEARLTWDNGVLKADTLSGRLFGGLFGLNGEVNPSNGDVEVNGGYRKAWSASSTPSWVKVAGPTLNVALKIIRQKGEWQGNGDGLLADSNGVALALLKFIADQGNASLELAVPGAMKPVAILTYNVDQPAPYRLSATNPQTLLAAIVNKKLIPPALNDYTIRISGQGDLENFRSAIDAVSTDGVRGITSAIKVKRDGKEWRWSNNIGLRLPGSLLLAGDFTGLISQERITVTKGNLSDVAGRKMLNLSGDYDISRKSFQTVSLSADRLPFAALLRLFMPSLPEGFHLDLDAEVGLSGDNLEWQSESIVRFPDGVSATVSASGGLRNDQFTLRKFDMMNQSDDTLYLSAAGGFNTGKVEIDSLVVMLSGFPISRFFEIAYPKLASAFGGQISARIEASGPISKPVISADVHLTQGVFSGVEGIWGNFRLSTGDTLYRMDELSIGQGQIAWINADGWRGKSGAERAEIIGSGLEFGQFIHAVSGLKLPLEGKGNFEFRWFGGDQPRSLVGNAKMMRGHFAGAAFDEVDARLRLTGFDETRPSLWFDTLKVNWGDARGTMFGELPLTSNRSIAIKISAEGRLTALLPRLDKFFSHPEGTGQFSCEWGGKLADMKLTSAKLSLKQAGIQMSSVIRDFRSVDADIELDESGRIRILNLRGKIDGVPVQIANRDADPLKKEENILVGDFDLGILQFQTGNDGIWIVIPGLMEPEWGGYLALHGKDGKGYFEVSGPAESPKGIGDVALSNMIFTYPLLTGEGKPSTFAQGLINTLLKTRWYARVRAEKGCRYIREVSGLGAVPGWQEMNTRFFGGYLQPDIRLLLDLRLDDNPMGLLFNGSINDSLSLSGEITSSQGTIEFLDLRFNVDRVGLQFNPAELEPVIYGSATTEVVDSSGITRQVRIRIRADESEALRGTENQERVGIANFAVSLEDDQGHSQEQILYLLGYSPQQLPGRLSGLGGQLVEGATPFRRWTRVVERSIEEWTGLDRIDIKSSLAQNLIEKQITPISTQDPTANGKWRSLSLLQGSSVTLGKYILPTLFVSYTGALANPSEAINATRLGIRHDWDAIFRISRISNNLTLNYRYEYNSLARSANNSVLIRYGWVFNLQKQIDYIFSTPRYRIGRH